MAFGLVPWPIESIPDEDDVYMRVHKVFFRGKTLQPGVFRNHGSSMSVDWEKYSSPEETRHRAKNPLDNGVISLAVSGVRKIDNLSVIHDPTLENRSHSGVLGLPDSGEDVTEMRIMLLGITEVIVSLSMSAS